MKLEAQVAACELAHGPGEEWLLVHENTVTTCDATVRTNADTHLAVTATSLAECQDTTI